MIHRWSQVGRAPFLPPAVPAGLVLRDEESEDARRVGKSRGLTGMIESLFIGVCIRMG